MTVPYGTAPSAGNAQPQQAPQMQYAASQPLPQYGQTGYPPAQPQQGGGYPPAGQQGQTQQIPPQGQPPQWPGQPQPQQLQQQPYPQQAPQGQPGGQMGQQTPNFGGIRLDAQGRFADPRYPAMVGLTPEQAAGHFSTMRNYFEAAQRTGGLQQQSNQQQVRPAAAPPQPQQQAGGYPQQDPRMQGIQDYVRQAVEPMLQPVVEMATQQRANQIVGELRQQYGQRFAAHEATIIAKLGGLGDPGAWTRANVEALFAYELGQEALRGQSPQGGGQPQLQYPQQGVGGGQQPGQFYSPAGAFFSEGPTPPTQIGAQAGGPVDPRRQQMAHKFGMPYAEYDAWGKATNDQFGNPVVPYDQYQWGNLQNPNAPSNPIFVGPQANGGYGHGR